MKEAADPEPLQRALGYEFRDRSLLETALSHPSWSHEADGSRGNELWDRVWEVGEPYGIGPGAPNHVERVESGLLSFGGDTTPDSNPLETGMARFVHVDTDVDYIGKAALQQVMANGGPERLFVGLFVESDTAEAWPLPARTPVLCDGEQVGVMTAIVYSHRLQRTIALAQIARWVVESASVVEVSGPGGKAQATITDLPFL